MNRVGLMGIYSYIIVSDLHDWDSNKESRIDYISEISYTKDIIYNVIQREKEAGHIPVLIYLGDVFDRSYKTIAGAMKAVSEYSSLSDYLDGNMYSVIGNHELSFPENNPFWYLMTDMESEMYTNRLGKMVSPKGFRQALHTPDVLINGNVSFVFNHFGLPLIKGESKHNYLLSHNDLMSGYTLTMNAHKFNYAVPIMDYTKSDVIKTYRKAYVGHMHTMYDKVMYGDVMVQYVASQGRTNKDEVQDSFLERTIPIIRVENGELLNEEDYVYNLMPREQCVKKEVEEVARSKRRVKEAKKVVANYIPTIGDPYKDVQELSEKSSIMKEILGMTTESSGNQDTIFSKLLGVCNNLGI